MPRKGTQMNSKIRALAAALAVAATVGVATVAAPASGNSPNACQAKVAGVKYVHPVDGQSCAASERPLGGDAGLTIR
jgi:hypothetical protein